MPKNDSKRDDAKLVIPSYSRPFFPMSNGKRQVVLPNGRQQFVWSNRPHQLGKRQSESRLQHIVREASQSRRQDQFNPSSRSVHAGK